MSEEEFSKKWDDIHRDFSNIGVDNDKLITAACLKLMYEYLTTTKKSRKKLLKSDSS